VGRLQVSWIDGKFQHHAAGVAHAFAHPLGQHDVMAVARRDVRARLRQADDRPPRLQLAEGQAVVHGALQIQRGHIGVVRIVEPRGGAQFGGLALLAGDGLRVFFGGHWRCSSL
jgi:hypothetical protein